MPSLTSIFLCFGLLQAAYPRSMANENLSTVTTTQASALSDDAVTQASALSEAVSTSVDNTTELLAASAAKLVRLRREPPVTIVKHIIRSSKRSKPKYRRRYKRPKIKYSYAAPPPSSYSYAEPTITSYYKSRPASHTSSSLSSSPPSSSSSYTYGDDYSHFGLDSSDFELHPSSYESQSMDLDFYSHSAKGPSVEYDFDVETKYGGESYAKPSPPRQPHVSYGVPQDYSYSSDFNAPPSHYGESANSLADGHHHYSADTSWESTPPKGDDSFQLPYPDVGSSAGHVPATKYGVPAAAAEVPDSYSAPAPSPSAEYHPSDIATSSQGDYSLYDHKIPNSGYGSFGEPPVHPVHPGDSASDVEITPSFEIKLPPSTGYEAPPSDGNKYQATSNSHPGHFAEPPPPPPPATVAHAPPPSQPHPGSAEDYLPPTQELPLNTNHKPPTYDYPKSSYEVPIYDPVPFEASNNEHHEFYPPHPYPGEEVFVDSQPSHEPEESQQDSRYVVQPPANIATPTRYTDQPPPSPPAPTHNEQPPLREEPAEPTEPPKPTRGHKRKRLRGSTNKHILDAPELEKAFEAGHRSKYSDLQQQQHDAVVNESNLSVNKLNNGDNYAHQQPWNPLRIRTTAAHTQASTTPALLAPLPQQPPPPQRERRPYRGQSRRLPTTVTPAPNTDHRSNGESPKISILSVEKSRSQNYYDGTVPPPMVHMPPGRPSRYKVSPYRTSAGSVSPRDAGTSKRTTKSTFETTYFKAPINDRVTQNLPKNHKPY